MTEQQAEALRSTAAALEDIADLVEQDIPPPLDWTLYNEMIDETATDNTSFGKTWDGLKQCVESHHTLTSTDGTIDPNDERDHLTITSRHPDGERELKFDLRYYGDGSIAMKIGLPSRAQIAGSQE